MNACNAINAIFSKECKDAVKNKSIIMMLVLFPFFSFVFKSFMGKEEMAMMLPSFFTMHIIMVPIISMASIIGEEKENGTLRALMFANVSPMQYLIGISLFVLLIILCSSCFFLFILDVEALYLFKFFAVTMLITICSIILGAVVGMFAKNQMSVGPIATPIGILFGMSPMMSQVNGGIAKMSKYFYSQISFEMIKNINNKITFFQISIYIVNILIFLIIFICSYKMNRFDK